MGLRTCSACPVDVTDNQIVVPGHKRGSNATFLYSSSPPDITNESKISVDTMAKWKKIVTTQTYCNTLFLEFYCVCVLVMTVPSVWLFYLMTIQKSAFRGREMHGLSSSWWWSLGNNTDQSDSINIISFDILNYMICLSVSILHLL